MENENKCPVAEQVCQEEIEAIQTQYTIAPDGSVVETTAQNQILATA